MTSAPDEKKSGDGPRPGKPNRKTKRAERLADELRANLRRRKDQSRLRSANDDGAAADTVPGDAAPDSD
ncbi:MAG: hypothetical protein ABL908_01770 [Hyphomicrobium sp.]